MSSLSPSSPSFELASALAGAPAPVLETAISLLDAAAPLIEGGAAAGTSPEDRKLWLAAVARLAIRVVAVLEGAADDKEERNSEEHCTAAAAFEGGKVASMQQLPLTLSALLAAFDVRCVVGDRSRRDSARHLAGWALARRGGRSQKKQKERREGKKPSPISRARPSERKTSREREKDEQSRPAPKRLAAWLLLAAGPLAPPPL